MPTTKYQFSNHFDTEYLSQISSLLRLNNFLPRLNVYILLVKMMVNFIEYPHKIKEESVLR